MQKTTTVVTGNGKSSRFPAVLVISAILLLTLMVPTNLLASDTLRLGMVNSSSSKMIKLFKPLLQYLTDKGVSTDKVITAKTLEQLQDYLVAGKVDFIFESPYGALRMMDDNGATPLLIREKKGVKEYNAVIFVKADSPIKSLDDLRGKVVAFEDPTSTSSFFLPKGLLDDAGLKSVESRDPVPDAVAYYFSKADDNTVAQVLAGKGAQAGGIKKGRVEGKPEFRTLTPESVFVPRHVVMVRKGVDASGLKKALLEMKNDPDAKDVLKAIKTPSGFSEFDGDSVDFMNTVVRKALKL